MKIIKRIEFEADDFKMFSAVIAGKCVSTNGLSEDMKKILPVLRQVSDDVRKYQEYRWSALSGLKNLPVELRRRYFSDFIKSVTQPVIKYDCEGKNIIGKKYPLLEDK